MSETPAMEKAARSMRETLIDYQFTQGKKHPDWGSSSWDVIFDGKIVERFRTTAECRDYIDQQAARALSRRRGMMARCEHCNNGWLDRSDTECVNGVLIDIDEAHEGWQRDTLYPPAPCTACADCGGSGYTRWLGRDNSEEVGDCEACGGTGWQGGVDQSQQRLHEWADLPFPPAPGTEAV